MDCSFVAALIPAMGPGSVSRVAKRACLTVCAHSNRLRYRPSPRFLGVFDRWIAVLVSRQFVDMARSRIEGLLAAFPKLLAGQDKSRQHTFIETESVRYVYFPIEGMHVVMITTKASNIVEDLDTLQLIAKCVPDFGMSEEGEVNETTVLEHAFDIIFAFDEAISAGGQAEQVKLDQIRLYMEMDSSEEKLQLMIKKSRMESAASAGAAAQRDIAKARREGRPIMGGVGSSSMPGVGSSSFGSGSGGGGGGMGGSMGGVGSGSSMGFGGKGRYGLSTSSSSGSGSAANVAPPAASTAGTSGSRLALGRGGKRSGMALGRKGDTADSALREMGIPTGASASASASSTGTMSAEAAVTEAAARAAAAVAAQTSTLLSEQVSCRLTRDGSLLGVEIRGDLTVKINDGAAAAMAVQCARTESSGAASGFRFDLHPRMDKNRWTSEMVLAAKDATKGVPVGGNGVKVLRWKLTSKDEASVPLTMTCWPDPLGDGTCQINAEFALQADAWPGLELSSVVVSLPLPAGSEGVVVHSCSGVATASEGALLWRIPSISAAAPTGSLDATVPGEDVDGFFPVQLGFQSAASLSGLTVVAATAAADPSTSFRNEFVANVAASNYVIE